MNIKIIFPAFFLILLVSLSDANSLIQKYRDQFPQDNRNDAELIVALGEALEAQGKAIEEIDPDFAKSYHTLKQLAYPSLSTEYIRGLQRGIEFYTGRNDVRFHASVNTFKKIVDKKDKLQYTAGKAGVLAPTLLIFLIVIICFLAFKKQPFRNKRKNHTSSSDVVLDIEASNGTNPIYSETDGTNAKKSSALRYGARGFAAIFVLMTLNSANCSAGRELGTDEYIVRVVLTSVLFGLPVFLSIFIIQKLRERLKSKGPNKAG